MTLKAWGALSGTAWVCMASQMAFESEQSHQGQMGVIVARAGIEG